MAKRKALGKGLSALIPETKTHGSGDRAYFHCPVELIEPNPNQPRKIFDHKEFDELVASIQEKGVLTPLLVTAVDTGYRLIAGERRLRASLKAGLRTVPVVVRESTPMEALELALIENIHRKDLNPIEEAHAYRQCLDGGGLTQDSLAKRLGKDRSTITNMLRLLSLPEYIQSDLLEERISMAHARVLAGVKNAAAQRSLRDSILEKGLSVRQTEDLSKGSTTPRKKPAPNKKASDEYLVSIADNLKRSLGTKVDIRRRGQRGQITIHFYSDDELTRLLELLG